ncbi:uncharacterized protein LOC143242057 isoform X2 [Tachypleus tridentatus]|uniref:uncharacterized protein LOC143242057 isoform X2 n=1 Tax=Tachypleus tridentatus TaxID=6853 RepID=UPI003FCFE9A7
MKAKQRKPLSDGEPSEDSVSHSTDDNGDKCFLSEENSLCGDKPRLQTKPNEKNSRNLVHRECSVPRSPSTPSSLSSADVPTSPCSAPSSPTKYRQSTLEQRRHCSVSLPRSSFQILDGRTMPAHTFNEQRKKNVLRQVKTSPVVRTLSKVHSSGCPSTCSDYETVSSEGAVSLQTSLRCPGFGLCNDTEISNLYNVSSQRTSTVFDSQDDLFTFSLKNNDTKSCLVDDGFLESQPGLSDRPSRSRCLESQPGLSDRPSRSRCLESQPGLSDRPSRSRCLESQPGLSDRPSRSRCFSLDFSSHSNSCKKLLSVPKEIQKHRKHYDSSICSVFQDECSKSFSPGILSANTSSKENDSSGCNKDQSISENKPFKIVKIIPKIVFSTSKENLTVDEMNNSNREKVLCNKGVFNECSPHNNNMDYFTNPNKLDNDQSKVPESSYLVSSVEPYTSNSVSDNKSQNISVNKKHSLHISFLDHKRATNNCSSPNNLTNRRKGSFTSWKGTELTGINRSVEMKSLLSFWSSLNSATNQHRSCNASFNQLQSSETFTNHHSSVNLQTNQHTSQNLASNQHMLKNSSANQHVSQKSSSHQQTMLSSPNNQNSPLQGMQSSCCHSNSRGNQNSARLLPSKRIIQNAYNTKLESGGQLPVASIERNYSYSDLQKVKKVSTESPRTFSVKNPNNTLKYFRVYCETPQSKVFSKTKSANTGLVRNSSAQLTNQSQEVPKITVSSPDEQVTGLREERGFVQDVQSFQFGGSTGCRSLAEDFHQEMIAWYENHQGVKEATFV